MPALKEIFHRREELPDGGHLDIIDTPEEPANPDLTKSTKDTKMFMKADDVLAQVESIAAAQQENQSLSLMFTRMAEIKNGDNTPDELDEAEQEKTPREWIWATVPKDIVKLLNGWKRKFVKAIPGAEAVDDLHITLFHDILNMTEDLSQIVSTCANATPCEATLGSLRAFRTENHGVAVVIDVASFQLQALRHKLEGEIEHTPSIHRYSPHITLAYVPDCEGTAIEGLELFGIKGQEFIVETINAGTEDSHHPCAMLGANAEWISRFEPTPTAISEKSMGMSTLTAESGGVLMQPGLALEDDNEKSLDDDETEDSDEDEQWLRRSQEMADSLDDMFGGF